MGGFNNPFPPVWFGTNQNGPFKDAYKQRPVIASRAKRPADAVPKEQIKPKGVFDRLTNVTVKVVDAKTGDDITTDAKVYVDGMLVTRYENGTFVSQAPTGMSTLIQAAKDGYLGASTTLVLSAAQRVDIALSPDPNLNRKYTIGVQIYPALANVEVSSGNKSANTDKTGFAVLPEMDAGTTTITASLAGYEPTEILPTISKDETFSLVLVASSDAGTTEGSPAPTAIVSASSLDFTLGRDQREDVASNLDYENYFTSAQCRVYLGNLFLDELQSIQYVLQSNKVPVYGYASQFMDAIAQGRSLVQGQLAINYVMDRYLYVALGNYQKLFVDGQSSTEVGDTADLQTFIQSPSEVADKLDVVSLRKLKQLDKSRIAKEIAANPYQNAVYQPTYFDMTVEIGSGEQRTVRRIEKAVLISNEQVLDQSGEHLLDVYGFVARRLR
jgi:hypothetical protein